MTCPGESVEAAVRGDEVTNYDRVDGFVRRIAGRMLARFPDVQRWELTDDVAQQALLRLLSALRDVQPESRRHLENLAALQIRRTLIDLARKQARTLERGAGRWTPARSSVSGRTLEQGCPAAPESVQDLMEWAELHESVDRLPDQVRETFQLIWYRELSKPDVARLLGVHVRTVQRRWRLAREQLASSLPTELAAE